MQIRRMIVALASGILVAGCSPPQVQYPYTPLVQARRDSLYTHLLELLPEPQRKEPAAQEEARWLADTAYKAAAGISRVNDSHFPGWAGNALINSRFQDRGLCWHYQHDMYRELRRRKLHYYRLGCCVRDKAKASEHNCVYIAPAQSEWPHVWVLDAWLYNGRLRVSKGEELDSDRWSDLPGICQMLEAFYNEGHNWPIEHWYVLRGTDGKYCNFMADEGVNSPQAKRMRENIQKGYREHPGSPTNY